MVVNILGLDHIVNFCLRNKDAFFKNQVEKYQPPLRFFEDDVWEDVSNLPKITEVGSCICLGFGLTHD